MESSVVLFKPRIHRLHALILLTPTRWITMTGWRTSIGLHPVFKHVWIVVPCLIKHRSTVFVQTRLSGMSLLCGPLFVYRHQSLAWVSHTFDLQFRVCAHASVNSHLCQTCLRMVACSYKHQF